MIDFSELTEIKGYTCEVKGVYPSSDSEYRNQKDLHICIYESGEDGKRVERLASNRISLDAYSLVEKINSVQKAESKKIDYIDAANMYLDCFKLYKKNKGDDVVLVLIFDNSDISLDAMVSSNPSILAMKVVSKEYNFRDEVMYFIRELVNRREQW